MRRGRRRGRSRRRRKPCHHRWWAVSCGCSGRGGHGHGVGHHLLRSRGEGDGRCHRHWRRRGHLAEDWWRGHGGGRHHRSSRSSYARGGCRRTGVVLWQARTLLLLNGKKAQEVNNALLVICFALCLVHTKEMSSGGWMILLVAEVVAIRAGFFSPLAVEESLQETI